MLGKKKVWGKSLGKKGLEKKDGTTTTTTTTGGLYPPLLLLILYLNFPKFQTSENWGKWAN